MPEKTSLALIVPCYNEAVSIPYFEVELGKLQQRFSAEFPQAELSVTVVDNNSTDGSAELLYKLAGRMPFVRVERCATQGYGAALKHGFAAAKGDYLSFLDLDNTYPMEQLLDMFRLIQKQNFDIVYGARLHPHSDIGLIRKLGNIFYVFLLRILLNSGLTDVCSGMRVFRSDRKAAVLALSRNDLSFSIEFTAFALTDNWKISELPVPYRDRVGDSKLSVIRDGFVFLYVVLRRVLQKK